MNIQMILEMLLFETIDLIPMVVLALTPFRDRIRLSMQKTAILFLFLFLGLCSCRILAVMHHNLAGFFSAFWIIVYLITYRVCVRCSIFRLLFVLLLILNYGSFISILFNYIKINFIQQLTINPYSWISSLITLGILLVSYPIIFILTEKHIRPLIKFPENDKIWRMLWIVPAIFCLCYYYNLYTNGGIISFCSHPQNVLYGIFLTIGAIFITYIAARLVQESNQIMLLKSENYQLSLQKLQFEYLHHKIEEARHARHDIRQIMTVLQAYIADENISGLKAYVLQYTKELPSDSCIVYCEHYALNALLQYYEALAKKNNISFKITIGNINFSDFSDSELTILFGNLLENAIEACMRQTSLETFIRILITDINDKIMIQIDNSYNGVIKTSPDGNYFSSKEDRMGIGILSIRKIVNLHNGIINFLPQADTFSVSIIFFHK